MRYEILHNIDAMFIRGYEPGDRLIRGYTGTLTTGETPPATERIFAIHNRDDRPDGKDAPSLSVGDVVVLTPGRSKSRRYWFTCLPAGWREIKTIPAPDIYDGPYADVAPRLMEDRS
jgi:hypothetical protein